MNPLVSGVILNKYIRKPITKHLVLFGKSLSIVARNSLNKSHQFSSTFEGLVGKCIAGCPDAPAELADLVNEDFYAIAKRLCTGKHFAHSLHATYLMNEACLRLVKSGVFQNPRSKRYLFAAAGRTMKNVVVDYLRHKNAKKRISEFKSDVYLEQLVCQLAESRRRFEGLYEAIERLESHAPRWADVIHMRFFLGMTLDEIAEALEISKSTVEDSWRKARVWLFSQLNEK